MCIQPKGRSFGKEAARRQDAMSWNADVEQRRREHHERRCAEDPIYKRVYERQQEMMQRVQKMNSVAMAQLAKNMADDGDVKAIPETGRIIVPEEMQRRVEGTMQAFDLLKKEEARIKAGIARPVIDALPVGMLSVLFGDQEAERRMKEMEKEVPYAEEIRKTDAEFDEELIRMGGFEW